MTIYTKEIIHFLNTRINKNNLYKKSFFFFSVFALNAHLFWKLHADFLFSKLGSSVWKASPSFLETPVQIITVSKMEYTKKIILHF